ncbi:hypothetical protein CFE70_004950 [Pyrenophora teres f. teres 0-1]
MRYGIAYLLLQLVALSTAQWDNNSTAPIELAPAPWTLKGTVYTVTFVPLSTRLPTKAYAPLERQYASAVEGKYIGILGQIQIIRYTDSPVGPYDELLIVPGFFKYNYTDASGKKEEKKNVRVNWNIPKHLARFDWVEKGNGETTVKVYPHDTTGDLSESKPAEKPWFQATFKPNLPIGIPFSTDLYGLLGVNTTLAQPPLPSGNGSYDELPGTDHWAATVPNQVTNRATLGIVDMKQGDGDVEEGRSTNAVGDEYFPNFWPGIPRLNVASKLEDATVTFSAPEIWKN